MENSSTLSSVELPIVQRWLGFYSSCKTWSEQSLFKHNKFRYKSLDEIYHERNSSKIHRFPKNAIQKFPQELYKSFWNENFLQSFIFTKRNSTNIFPRNFSKANSLPQRHSKLKGGEKSLFSKHFFIVKVFVMIRILCAPFHHPRWG